MPPANLAKSHQNVMPDPWAALNALPDSVLIVNRQAQVQFANFAAEQLFEASATYLARRGLRHFLPQDSPLFSLVGQVFATGNVVSEYGVTLESPRLGPHFVTIQVAPITDDASSVIVTIHEQSMAHKIDRQLTHRSAARSVTAMAAILAHEVKNPLSGIRGAAQLIEPALPMGDRALTQLICDETDRICALVDRMEAFADRRPIERKPVNIHQVLEHVRKVAQAGFGKTVRMKEEYDPSLPPVLGNRDQLIQVFLNLVKNAVEAAPQDDGEIVLSTAFRPGIRLAVPSSDSRMQLPLVVSVQDNGDGIPEDIRGHLFDPFVTTKAKGTGLGLALVAKIVNDHGGVIEFASEPRRTVFRVMLPMFSGTASVSNVAGIGEGK
ncbi:MAG: nitrogen regulation protein NR(II) [Alphaproteobacteria bacterium]